MRVDGKLIAEDIKLGVSKFVQAFPIPIQVAFVVVGDDKVTKRFVDAKQKFADAVGIKTINKSFLDTITQLELEQCVQELGADDGVHAIVVQLPLPQHIDREKVFRSIPVSKDADVLTQEGMAQFRKGESIVFPPVAGAVQEILERANYSVHGKDVVILGHGKLVGMPVAILMRHNDAHVTVVDQPVRDLAMITRDAEVIVSGVGKAHMLKPNMLKDGVVLIDAGSSESEGMLAGDIDPACEELSSIFSPVPGGVGPITVAILMKNVARLAHQQYVGVE